MIAAARIMYDYKIMKRLPYDISSHNQYSTVPPKKKMFEDADEVHRTDIKERKASRKSRVLTRHH